MGKALSVKTKKLRRFLLALGLVILSPVILLEGISIASYIRYAVTPSATRQLLDFVGAPRGLQLPRKNPQETGSYSADAFNTDYHPIESLLAQRFPDGTSQQAIERFTTGHSCYPGSGKILCSFGNAWYPAFSTGLLSPLGFISACSDNVYLTFSFDAASRLTGIEIIGSTNCV